MFTGIVEEAGIVEQITRKSRAIELTVRSNICGRDVKLGDSIAVNGCCLTVTHIATKGKQKLLQFDLLQETWKRTNFNAVRTGSLVNLERSLRVGDRLGGHFVTGHIDDVGKIVRWERAGADYVLEISAPPAVMRYVIFKGSIAVDGISLTVASVTKKKFTLWIIPHTYEVTTLRERKVGDALNVEADMLGKYVEKFASLKG
ncbi:MAG: riboflavin synthase, alpha subunit [Verrucomicrobiales bacterium]|nr:riboflavin synthase, alpha subunit [Verrucomicrobiales bacterium]